MLQKRLHDDQPFGQEVGTSFTAGQIYDVLKRRWLFFVIPFVVVFAVGSLAVMLWPAVYRAEGKILVESQQIPSELVRPTVSTLASERIQVIEQRIMTRDNLVALANKYRIGAGWRQRLSGTEAVDFMRERTQIKPLDLRIPVRQSTRQTIAFTIGFEHENPGVAMRIANEFVTMILQEDVRTRTNFAAETTKFLERETKKLEGDLNAVEVKLSDLKRRDLLGLPRKDVPPGESQLALLRAELVQKSTIYSDSHPDIKLLKGRIAALEKTVVPATAKEADPELGVDALERQQEALQKDLETTNQKLSAARLGESLERGQQSERLEVIEQPSLPRKPISPNRPKFLAVVFVLAALAGGGLVFLLETLDGTIRRSADLMTLVDSDLLVAIPYISTNAEIVRQTRNRKLFMVSIVAVVVIAVAVAIAVLPTEELIERIKDRLAN